MMTFRVLTVLAAGAMSASAALAAQPADTSTAAIFAGGNLTFNTFSTVTGGPVISNGNVLHSGGTLNVPSLYAGGTFAATGTGFQNTIGDVLFNGSINTLGGPGSTIGGNITSAQGSVFLAASSTTIKGNVTAAGEVSQPFTYNTINGNVTAGGNVRIDGTVGGSVTYGATYTPGTFAAVGGGVFAGGPVSPTPYQPLSLPAGRNLAAVANNITLSTFQSTALTPGTYGTLTFASGNTVSLTAGDYTFKGITNSFSLNKLSFNTTAGPIRLFVDGDLNFNLVQVINGQPLSPSGTPNPADSKKILVEVDGSYTGNADLYGTIFAPNGDITLSNFADLTGRALAGGNVTLGSTTITLYTDPWHTADINDDGKVSVGDLGILATHFGQATTQGKSFGDLNSDGTVSVGDLGILATYFGQSDGAASNLTFNQALAQFPNLQAAIPEPSAMIVLLGLVPMVRRSRRV